MSYCKQWSHLMGRGWTSPSQSWDLVCALCLLLAPQGWRRAESGSSNGLPPTRLMVRSQK